MNLGEQITELVSQLGDVDGVDRVYRLLPADFSPPVILLGTQDPWLTPGETFNPADWFANWLIHVFTGDQDPETQLDSLGGLVEATIAGLDPEVFITAQSGPPTLYAPTGAGGLYLFARLSVTAAFTLT